MPRARSIVAPDWWDYTTLDKKLVEDVAKLTVKDMQQLSRPGFEVRMYDTLESFYLAEALEYIEAWQQATANEPCGICGPIGPTEQLPLVALLVNSLNLNLKHAHFWGMDEWCINGKEAPATHDLSFEKADRDMCFNKIRPELMMPESNLHFPKADKLAEYTASYDKIKCKVIQGGQGETKHWAFNDPLPREGKYIDEPMPPKEYLKLPARRVKLHPMTLIQNARTSGGGKVSEVPTEAFTVGPVETWKAERVSIWQAGCHDNAFGMRLTAFMIAKKIPDSSVPMSLLALHDNVRFSYYRPGIGTCEAEMH